MGEHEDRDVSDCTVMESSKESVSDHVTGKDAEKTKVVEQVASEVQVQGQGVTTRASTESAVAEGGSCNGEEIMAGVMGSDIYVDGVCINSSQEATSSQGGCSEKGLKNLGDGVGEASNSGSMASSDTGVKALNLGTEGEVGGSSGLAESKEEEKLEEGGLVVGEVGKSDMADDSTLLGFGGGDGPDARAGSAVEGSTNMEIQVVAETVAVATGEERLEGGLGKDDVNSHEVRLSESETQDQRVENGIGVSTQVVDSSVGETQVVIAAEKSELAEVAKDQATEANGSGGHALQVLETQKVGVLDDEVWKPGIETTGATSSTVAIDSTADAQFVGDESVVMADNENLNPKVEATRQGTHDSDAVKGVIPSCERDSVSTEKDSISYATSNSFDGQTQVTVDGKIASMNNEEIGSPDVEGMDTDAFNENFCFSVEELQATFETANGSTENHYDEFADLSSSQKPVRAEQASIQKQQGELDTCSERTINHSKMCLDSTTLCQLAQAVGDKAAEMDDKVQSDPNYKGPVHMQLDGKLPSSGVNQHSKPEADYKESESQTTSMNQDKSLTSAAEVSQPAGKREQELKLEDKSAACDPAEGDSNMRDLMDGQEHTTHVEELGGKEMEISEQQSEAATGCESTETDSQAAGGRQTAAVNNDITLDSSPELADQHLKVEDSLDENAGHDAFDVGLDMGQETPVQELDADDQHIDLHDVQEIEAEEQDTDSEQPKTTDEKSAKRAAPSSGNTVKVHQTRYQLQLNDEGEFSVSDLVWGKVRSHPWWPGQIFYPSDASEKAMKYHKKDCFLVAYFGDRTFAWNEASVLKPFRLNFSQVEKQSNSETFQNAVSCALEEFSRRVEFGLACLCIPRDIYDKIKFQVVENAGIREEASVRDITDKSFHADLFEPGKLVEYMKALAQSPAGEADRLELVIAKSQLLSFYRLKGYSQLPEFQFCGGLLENADTLHFEDEVIEDASPLYKDDGQSSSGLEILQAQRSSYHKRKHNLKDAIYPRKKERSLSDLMGDSWDSVDDEISPDVKANNKLVSPSSGKKRRGSDSFPDDSAMVDGKKNISLAKVSTPISPKPSSFKIGECIRRVASQMTGSPSILKSNSQKLDGGSDGLLGDGSDILIQHSEDPEMRKMNVPTEYSSLDELLSQLHLAARDPLKGYSFFTVIISFFSDFRNAVIMEKHDRGGGKRRQASHSIGGSPETFEFEDMNDTYWTDRVIQNGSEEQPPRKTRKRDTLLVSVEPDKPLNRSNSRKRYSDGNGGVLAEKPVGYVDENAPAELVMHFPVVDSIPSEMSLNKMFKRFGPLKEYETETDMDTNRARVVFKKCSDAEAAYGSAPKFNIFGSTLVNYQLNYTVSVPFKTQQVATLTGEEDETLFLQF